MRRNLDVGHRAQTSEERRGKHRLTSPGLLGGSGCEGGRWAGAAPCECAAPRGLRSVERAQGRCATPGVVSGRFDERPPCLSACGVSAHQTSEACCAAQRDAPVLQDCCITSTTACSHHSSARDKDTMQRDGLDRNGHGDGQQVSSRLATGQRTSEDVTSAPSCFATAGIEDILLQVALGHSLPRSESPLAALPGEVIQQYLAPSIRDLFVESLKERGLLTPDLEPAKPPTKPPPLAGKWRAPNARAIKVSQRPPKVQRVARSFAASPPDEDDCLAHVGRAEVVPRTGTVARVSGSGEKAARGIKAAWREQVSSSRIAVFKFEDAAVVRQPAPTLPNKVACTPSCTHTHHPSAAASPHPASFPESELECN